MAGIKNLSKIQIGKETTKGTAAAATTIWRGEGAGLKDGREVVLVEENVGYISGTTRSYTPFVEAALTMGDTPATFEQLPYILNASIKGETPAQDGSGSGYIYEYDLPTNAAATLYAYTIEAGDNQQAEEMEYSIVPSFTLSGASKEAVSMSAEWIGRQVATCSYTGALSLPSVEEILFGKFKLYIDTIGGSFGGTQKTSTLLGFDLSVGECVRAKYTGDGQVYFTFEQPDAPQIELKLTLEHDSTAVAAKADFAAETPKLIRLIAEGSSLTTAGTTYSKKTIIIDLAGKFTQVDDLGEVDGNSVVGLTFTSKYDETADDWGKFIVVNELSTLP